ncbi:MAG: DNA cytosine methyltransferase [Ruminococcus flavefaciens]|nr:DNA cytosine methyltransferase [Ruminococcus flavefaciens]MCM1487420.1 DNA cytosine methyltransferase [Bacillota bacterium]
MHKVIDLFAGAGGLSLGFKQTGKYEIAAAFEINQNAQKTYRKNHTGTEVYSDVCAADYKKLKKKYGKIDVVIGGPPCQGFSMANRQKNHVISQNNMLVKQYIRAVKELNPNAFVMENVETLKSDVHRFYLRLDEAEIIEKHHIKTVPSKILLLEEKYYSDEIAKDIQDIINIELRLWLEKDYKLLNIAYRQRKNLKKCKETLYRYKKKYLNLAEKIHQADNNGAYECFDYAADAICDFFAKKIDAGQVVKRIEKSIMIQRCLTRIKEIYDNELQIDAISCEEGITAIIQSYSVLEYITKMLGNYTFNMGVLNAVEFGAPQKRNRFVFLGIKKNIAEKIEMPKGTFAEENYRTVKDAIKDIENVQTIFETAEDNGTSLTDNFNPTALTPFLRDSSKLYNHIITQTREVAKARFEALEQGENFHSLDASLKENTYTDTSRTQNTIYQRLCYDNPSGTVLNVRKSMWIHPTIDRAVSIREAARLQTFPDSFVFCGTKDSQYQQVGNAVPPMLAKAIAEHLAMYLDGDENG